MAAAAPYGDESGAMPFASDDGEAEGDGDGAPGDAGAGGGGGGGGGGAAGGQLQSSASRMAMGGGVLGLAGGGGAAGAGEGDGVGARGRTTSVDIAHGLLQLGSGDSSSLLTGSKRTRSGTAAQAAAASMERLADMGVGGISGGVARADHASVDKAAATAASLWAQQLGHLAGLTPTSHQNAAVPSPPPPVLSSITWGSAGSQRRGGAEMSATDLTSGGALSDVAGPANLHAFLRGHPTPTTAGMSPPTLPSPPMGLVQRNVSVGSTSGLVSSGAGLSATLPTVSSLVSLTALMGERTPPGHPNGSPTSALLMSAPAVEYSNISPRPGLTMADAPMPPTLVSPGAVNVGSGLARPADARLEGRLQSTSDFFRGDASSPSASPRGTPPSVGGSQWPSGSFGGSVENGVSASALGGPGGNAFGDRFNVNANPSAHQPMWRLLGMAVSAVPPTSDIHAAVASTGPIPSSAPLATVALVPVPADASFLNPAPSTAPTTGAGVALPPLASLPTQSSDGGASATTGSSLDSLR